ncbi:MAG: glycoside hydrolase [Acidobacteriota bacterium]|nr:glycoside hydrolase [Acidobacteriota bacterium]
MIKTTDARLALPLLTGMLVLGLGAVSPAGAQITAGVDVNTSQKAGADSECAIAKNPTNKMQLFAACNTAGAGLFAARSDDLGNTWTYPDPADKTIADGDAGQGPAACCDPTLTWDTFGNLYLGYLDAAGANVVVLNSTDGGATWNTLATFPGSVDQPTVVAAATAGAAATSPVAVWVVWNQSGTMRASGAPVTGLGTIGAFTAMQTVPGTLNCTYGDVAIAPSGVVVQTCQTGNGNTTGPTNILVHTDADGLGPGNFGAGVVATTTNLGTFDAIPPQAARTIDSEAGLAYDSFASSPHFGRLYLVYTEETALENNDTDIMVRFSDNDGAAWSAPIRVNDDPAIPIRSQFLPRIASNPLSGNIAVCWHDARNSATNTAMQEFCTMATPAGAAPTFMANAAVSDGASTSTGASVEFGDYSGMAYFQGRVHPIWGDTSNSTGDNPNTTFNFDAYTDRVSGGAAAMEGDPHMKTVDGVHYDFQSAGEFVSLRGDGLEIQTRQTAIATSFFPGANPYTGLATCASLNTAVAARVGSRRITYQPNISGVPDPSGLQLRVDGMLRTLDADGIDLGDGGRIRKTAASGGFEIEFPNETRLVVTPGWWASQAKWYLNVNVYDTTATEGITGVLAPGSWLPALPDGSSLGPRPSSLAARYTQLYQTFADTWRVSDATSLFDYAPGTSTADFTLASWPKDSAPCELPREPVAKPLNAEAAQQACANLIDADRRANCVFDVAVTGERRFAYTYLVTQALELGTPLPPEPGPDGSPPAASRALSLHVGYPIALGDFDDAGADGTGSVAIDLEWRYAPRRSLELVLGRYAFEVDPSAVDVDIDGLSFYYKAYSAAAGAPRWFWQLGPGVFDVQPGQSTEGASGGLGWQKPISSNLEFEAAAQVFHLLSSGAQDDIDFALVQVGLKLTF